MKTKEIKGLLILVIVSIVVIIGIWLLTRNNNKNNVIDETVKNSELIQVQEDGSKINTSEKVKETREIEGIKIENIRITEKNGQTMLIADLTNKTEAQKERFLVNIIIYDKQGNEMGTIPGVIGEMQAGETIEMQAGITEDYINAYDFKIVKK